MTRTTDTTHVAGTAPADLRVAPAARGLTRRRVLTGAAALTAGAAGLTT